MSLESQLDEALAAISPEVGGMVDGSFYKLRFSSDEDSNTMGCALAWREAIPAERRAEVGRAVVRESSAWDLGGFDFDPRDGSLSYRIGVLHAREVLNATMMRELVRNSMSASESLRHHIFGTPSTIPAQAEAVTEAESREVAPFRTAILRAFEERGIEVDEDPDGGFVSVLLESESAEYLMAVFWQVPSRSVVCSGRYLFQIPQSQFEKAIPAICLMNCDLVVGNVGLALDDGHPWFSNALYVPPGVELTDEMVGSMFDYCWWACHEHDEQLRAFSSS